MGVLALTLVLLQTLGAIHRIEHGNRFLQTPLTHTLSANTALGAERAVPPCENPTVSANTCEGAGVWGVSSDSHSSALACLLFDHLAAGDGPPAFVAQLHTEPAPTGHAAFHLTPRPDLLAERLFQARAPPTFA